ncbi:MAG TPA: AAA family ATPase [Streptosporangiaceae bacterium]|nr:AAA family ATPase [Streptosporangiaceae bacterium]
MPIVPDEESLIGRDDELAVLNGVLARGEVGLVLIIGAPGMGKRSILREIRKNARNQDRPVVPAASSLTVDSDTTIDGFLTAVREAAESQPAPGPDGVSEDSSRLASGHPIVLILSYHPGKQFDEWFTEELITGTSRAGVLTVFLAGYESDLRRLVPSALRVVELGPLPEEPVSSYLRQLNEHLADKLDARELADYGALIRREPGMIPALRGLLELESEYAE